VARARRRTSADTGGTPDAGEFTANLNEIVAYNFRRGRELRGLTQDEAAQALEPYLGQRLPQASISAIERAFGGERRREFDAQEIVAFACAFDLPMLWFFLPPASDARQLERTTHRVYELYTLVLGREDQVDLLYERFRELGMPELDAADEKLGRIFGAPTARMLRDYRYRRKEMLLAMLDEYADKVDATADEMGQFFDHLRQVGVRGLIGEQLNDVDYLTSHRAEPKQPTQGPSKKA
jgi:transcriptional regulator with XRE-family HTH domain